MLKKRNQQGFTIIELLIVIVIMGVLGGMVVKVINGVHRDTRDSERKQDLEAIEGHLEAYAARNDQYPTSEQMQNDEFIAENFTELSTESLLDPSSQEKYSYSADPEECDNSEKNKCSGFTLSADLEEDGLGENDSNSDTRDEVRTNSL